MKVNVYLEVSSEQYHHLVESDTHTQKKKKLKKTNKKTYPFVQSKTAGFMSELQNFSC